MADFIIIFIFLPLHFLPTIIAFSRGHHQAAAILVLNLFLGWTFIGWIAALIWASTAVRRVPLTSTP